METVRVRDKVDVFRAWCERLPHERWRLYRGLMTEAMREDIPFAIGGGLALMAYSGQVRDTKDIDLYIEPKHRDAMIAITTEAGLSDYYDTAPYDRKWIYRSCRDDLIVDIMWAMANQRANVDAEWLNGPKVSFDGITFRFVRPEETLWSKLYVVQRDRCDWPDVLNMLYGIGPDLDWDRLLNRAREDAPLLAALVDIFRWLCPDRCGQLPATVTERLTSAARNSDGDFHHRANLLDTRPWFVPLLEEGQK